MENKGLILINTGNGKGKTTAALGTAIRAWGDGQKVLILQFIKGGWKYGELNAIQALNKLDQRIEQAEFIFKNHIEDRGQLHAIRQKAEDEIAVLTKERQKLYRYQPGSPQIGVLTEQLKKQRHIVKLCRNIETHSIEMEQRLQAARIEEQQAKDKKKEETRNRENQQRR